jgi:hypothetical protein
MESIGRDTMTVAEKEYLAMEKKKARLQKQRLVLLENEQEELKEQNWLEKKIKQKEAFLEHNRSRSRDRSVSKEKEAS